MVPVESEVTPLHQHLNTTQIRRECKGGRYVGGQFQGVESLFKAGANMPARCQDEKSISGVKSSKVHKKENMFGMMSLHSTYLIRAHIQDKVRSWPCVKDKKTWCPCSWMETL